MTIFLGDKYKFYKKYLKGKLDKNYHGELMSIEEFYHDKAIVREPIFEYNCLGLNDKPSGCPVCPVCKEPTYSMECCGFCGQRLEKDQSLKGCKGCNEFINGECHREGRNGYIGVCWMDDSEGEY